ncbi:hypothetical protein PSI23_20145 [Xenorhabdus sp. XENO-10]|uniref:Uncharacterized protein n=1 Tax=Xenorhabdus yunnanensis TaxID=3025878 RepID=A0ABT5LLW8_9GAMM|nr:hypothetical protein [Xenorhabdus yunnanensis]MDC9591528.1 hypothetical protein [Xenorhabdus yunnanensis]
MQIKSIGFSIKNDNNNIDTRDIMNHLINCSDSKITRTDYIRKILLSDDNNFYTGLVLTFRNQKKNFKSKFNDKDFKVEVEDLKGDEKLVSFNFFCLKKQNLKGIYLYYHGSCSINALFSQFQTRTNEYIRAKQEGEIKNLGDSPKKSKIKEINKKYSDRPKFSIILNKNNLEKMLASFKEIKSADFRFDSIVFSNPEMIATEESSRNIDVTFNIDTSERKKTGLIAQKLNNLVRNIPEIVKGRVVAVDYSNNEKVVDFFNCPTFLESYDFDLLADKVNGLTNQNYKNNEIIAIIKNQIISGDNKHEFN